MRRVMTWRMKRTEWTVFISWMQKLSVGQEQNIGAMDTKMVNRFLENYAGCLLTRFYLYKHVRGEQLTSSPWNIQTRNGQTFTIIDDSLSGNLNTGNLSTLYIC